MRTIWEGGGNQMTNTSTSSPSYNQKTQRSKKLLHKEFKALKSDTKTHSTQMADFCMEIRKIYGAEWKKANGQIKKKKLFNLG